MPQLDKLAFFSQYFWMTVFFFVLYYFILNFGIIQIFKNLKLRTLINNLFFFRMHKVDFDKGIIASTSKILNLYYSTVYRYIFSSFAFTLKKTNIVLKNNKITTLIYSWISIIDSKHSIIKELNDINIDEL